MNRELIMQQLFWKLTGTQPGETFAPSPDFPWLTAGRRRIFWSDVPNQPALFLTEDDNDYAHEAPPNRPRQLMLGGIVWIYAQDIDPSPEQPAAGSALNPLIDFVEQAIAPPVPFRSLQTLGLDNVVYCRIEGRIEVYPGDLGTQGVAVIPIRIQVAEGL